MSAGLVGRLEKPVPRPQSLIVKKAKGYRFIGIYLKY